MCAKVRVGDWSVRIILHVNYENMADGWEEELDSKFSSKKRAEKNEPG
jgi:hypothetical protein